MYRERLAALLCDLPLRDIRLASPFVLRTVDPAPAALRDRSVAGVSRIGKRLVLRFQDDFFLTIHLMIAGRLRWRPAGTKGIGGRIVLATLHFDTGTLFLTEAGTQRRAMLHITRGDDSLAQFDRGGIDPISCTPGEFAAALRAENHTLKRALTDPRTFSGIGNAYSDEILHAAQLSPLALTQRLHDDEVERLHRATRDTLLRWLDRLRTEVGDAFPETVTAFHPGMAVHGRFGEPCPECGAPVQRIRYAANETNYCARCQTGGRVLADRAMSRLLKQDWPRSIDEIE